MNPMRTDNLGRNIGAGVDAIGVFEAIRKRC